jgi:hypothetical protein
MVTKRSPYTAAFVFVDTKLYLQVALAKVVTAIVILFKR